MIQEGYDVPLVDRSSKPSASAGGFVVPTRAAVARVLRLPVGTGRGSMCQQLPASYKRFHSARSRNYKRLRCTSRRCTGSGPSTIRSTCKRCSCRRRSFPEWARKPCQVRSAPQSRSWCHSPCLSSSNRRSMDRICHSCRSWNRSSSLEERCSRRSSRKSRRCTGRRRRIPRRSCIRGCRQNHRFRRTRRAHPRRRFQKRHRRHPSRSCHRYRDQRKGWRDTRGPSRTDLHRRRILRIEEHIPYRCRRCIQRPPTMSPWSRSFAPQFVTTQLGVASSKMSP